MNAINPFTDPEFKRQLLDNEGRGGSYEDFELVDDGKSELKSIISGAPRLPRTAKNMILDASAIAKNEREQKALELTNSLNQVFSQMNREYGLDLNISLTNLSETLVAISNPKARRTFELYLSELYKSTRPILLLHMIQKLYLLIDYALDINRLTGSGSELSLPDLFICVEKIMSYINELNSMRGDIEVAGSQLELKKLAEENNDISLDNPESKEAIDRFMKLFNNDFNK